MSTAVANPRPQDYSASVISSDIKPSELDSEIAKWTSSAVSDKPFSLRDLAVSPVLHEGNSFLTFVNEILTFNKSEDDEDQISDDALGIALPLAMGAYGLSPNMWRRPRIATDGGGGVRLTWRAGEKEIRAVFRADMLRSRYLYVEKGEDHSTIKDFTSATLSDRLDWLVSTDK
jgi:hypothetical protein